MKEAALSLGSNLGDRQAHLADALTALSAHPDIALTSVSQLYLTPPWGVEEQPPFLNICALVRTGLEALPLLQHCLMIETELGRKRQNRWGPRLIDIDVLWYDEERHDTAVLTLPHPYMMERGFVLIPLAEIAGDRIFESKSVSEHAHGFRDEPIDIVDSPEWEARLEKLGIPAKPET